MTIIRRTTPFSQFHSLRHAVDQLFDESAFRPIARSYAAPRRLPLDVTSGDDAVTIEAALPGVRPEDVALTVHADALTISVKESDSHEAAEGKRVYREVRRSYGSRTLRLPTDLDVDAATATFENGMLRVTIPRSEQAKPRQIPLAIVTDAPAAPVAEPQGVEVETPVDEPVKAEQA